ncbi:MAG: hypothetical protein ACPGNV_04185 [Mangrovicoccus sp.]
MYRLLCLITALIYSSVTPGFATVLDALGAQQFSHGVHLSLAQFTSRPPQEPSPFNFFFGSDTGGRKGSMSFSHRFDLPEGRIAHAWLTLGIFDHDSLSVEDDMLTIKFDTIEQPDDMWRGISTGAASFSVATMPVPVDFLLDGRLGVFIDASAIPSGFSGNGIGVDFSVLTVEMAVAPLPPSLGLMTLGLAGLFGMRQWRRRPQSRP